MKLSEFDYELPKNLIAQKQIKPRDHSRLLVLDKTSGRMEHKHFYGIIDYFEKGDVLVLNNSKVFPARLIGKKKETGGKMEVFLLSKITPQSPLSGGQAQKNTPLTRGARGVKETWQCLVGGKASAGQRILFDLKLEAEIIKNNNDGTWEVGFNLSGKKMMEAVNEIGEMPLPPYIHRRDAINRVSTADVKNYQTVYADEKKIGSVAAPTAGLHFTPALLKALKKKGVQIEYVTLHVGLGTFASVKTEKIEGHKMHSEFFEIKKETIEKIIKAKKEGRRIIAVGTTSTRVLESIFNLSLRGAIATKQSLIAGSTNKLSKIASLHSVSLAMTNNGWAGHTDIFIYPGYKFKAVDAIITNFHLPKSTLLMLVSAFCAQSASASGGAGIKLIKKAYKEAIKKKYRFFSYGDAMFMK